MCRGDVSVRSVGRGLICHYCEAMRHPLITLLATCLLAAAGAVGGWYLFTEPASNAREVAGPRARAVPVETAVAEAGRAATRIRATGTLRASDAVVVQPEIAGRVTAILFEQGQAVAAGTPMIKLAPETLQAELVKAEAALVAGAGELSSAPKSLSRRGATAAQALDEARASLAHGRGRGRPRQGAPGRHLDHRPVRRRGRAEGDQRRPLRRARRRAGGAGADRSALPRFPPVRALADQARPRRHGGRDGRCAARAAPSRARSPHSTPRSTSTAARCSCAPPCPTPTAACGRACSPASTSSSTSGWMRCWCPRPRWSCRSAGPSSTGSRRARPCSRRSPPGVRRDGRVEITRGLAAGATVVVNGHVRLRDQAQVEIVPPAGES